MRSKHLLTGFGSALSLYPPEPERLSRLRKTRFPVRYHLTPLANAEARKAKAKTIQKAKAKTIRNAVERMVRLSARLDRNIQALVKSSKSGDRHNRDEGYSDMDSQRTLKTSTPFHLILRSQSPSKRA